MKPENLRRFDLNLLVTLQILLEERSVSRAAERLCLSQSAISRALGRLRDIFHDDLFIRRPHGLQPTVRALQLKSELTDVLGMVNRVVMEPEFEPERCERCFSISVIQHLSVLVLPQLLRRLQKEAPGVSIKVNLWSANSAADMATGRLDLCVNLLPWERDDFCREFLAPVKPIVVVSERHPLASVPSLERQQFLAHPHVKLDISEYSSQHFSEDLITLLDSRRVILSTPDLQLALEVISQSDAMMIGSQSFSTVLMDRYRLKAIAIPDELGPLHSDYQMIWHRQTDRNPAHIWFRQLLLEECQSLLALELEEVSAAQEICGSEDGLRSR